ncbi:MAG: MFS transporter [Nocardiopsaceae bacterium]|jgi:MFS family permease|nr:MFS transporter [Nocardiopsaceae bacterium]
MVMLLREPARPATVREHRQAPWFAIITVCFGAFMGQFDASVVTLAFPALQRQFTAGLAEVQWVSVAYLLALIALLVPAGRWSDRLGRKLVYLYGFVVFTAASAACGLAPNLLVLISLRLIQAAGAAMLQANSVALVSANAPANRRRTALAVQAAAQALGLALGPIGGGLLVGLASWRWVFLINVPVGIVAVIAGIYLLPRTRERARKQGADPTGMILLAAMTTGLLVTLSSVSGLALPFWAGSCCLLVTAVAGTALARRERRVPSPLIDLRMLVATGIAPALVGAMCAYMALFGPLVLIPQMLDADGQGPLAVGLVLVALPAGFGLAAVLTERALPATWPDRRRCTAGGLVAACGLLALAVPLPAAVLAVPLGLVGVGIGAYLPANNAKVMNSVPVVNAAAAGSLVSIARGMGTALGVAAVTLGLHIGDELRVPEAGVITAVGTLVGAAVVAIAATAARGKRGPRRISLGGRDD